MSLEGKRRVFREAALEHVKHNEHCRPMVLLSGGKMLAVGPKEVLDSTAKRFEIEDPVMRMSTDEEIATLNEVAASVLRKAKCHGS